MPPTLAPSRRTLGIAGFALAPILLLACYNDPDKFAEDSAEAICANNVKCGEVYQEFPTEDRQECVEIVTFNRQKCVDECTYYKQAARKCVRELKEGARWCNSDKQDLRPCNEVFQCDDPDLEFECGLSMPVREGCSVDPRGAGSLGWAVVLFGLAGLARRRRLR